MHPNLLLGPGRKGNVQNYGNIAIHNYLSILYTNHNNYVFLKQNRSKAFCEAGCHVCALAGLLNVPFYHLIKALNSHAESYVVYLK